MVSIEQAAQKMSTVSAAESVVKEDNNETSQEEGRFAFVRK